MIDHADMVGELILRDEDGLCFVSSNIRQGVAGPEFEITNPLTGATYLVQVSITEQ